MAPNIPPEDLHRMEQAIQHLSLMKSGVPERNLEKLASGYESGDNEDEDYLQKNHIIKESKSIDCYGLTELEHHIMTCINHSSAHHAK